MFSGGTSTKNKRAAELMAVIEGEILELERWPNRGRTRQSQEISHRSYALRFDTSTKIANQLLHLQTEGFGVEYLDERNKLVAAVTMQDAKRAAKRLFGDGKLLITVAGQPEGM